MAITTIRLPEDVAETLDRAAAARASTRSAIIREAIASWIEEHPPTEATDRLDLLDELVDYPGSGVGDLAGEHRVHLRQLLRDRAADRPR